MRFSLDDKYQATLIAMAMVSTVLFGVFIYRELFPEYKEYQNQYVEMEQWRAEETGEAMAPFKGGIKQIVLAKEDKGPESIDRCVSCHVAMKLPHFSAEKVARDVNGQVIVDAQGVPVKVPNEDYVWAKIDARIAELRDEKVLQQLEESGGAREVSRRLAEAEKLESWKTKDIHGKQVDMTRALAAHPLIGNETYPFEFHP